MFEFHLIKFVLVFINLMVLYFILRRILFKPVTEFIEKRTKSIKDTLENADKNREEAQGLKRSYEDLIKTAKDDADKILVDARSRANKEYDSIIASAKQDAEAVIVKAREEIGRERAQMIKEIRGQVAGLALAAASKVIEANMDTQTNKVLVDKFIDEAGAA